MAEQTMTKEEFHRMMEEERRITFNLLDEQTRAVMTDPVQFVRLLDMIATGVSTTVSNTLLVQAQFPSATFVMRLEDWQAKGFDIITDENGYYPLGIRQFGEEGEYLGADGKAHPRFKLYKGFDAEQTTDPAAAAELVLKPPPRVFIGMDAKKTMNLALFNSSPVECIVYDPKKFIDSAEDISEETGVRYVPETRTVVVRKIRESQWYPVIAHEIALGMFHREDGSQFDRSYRDFDASVISYILSARLRLPTSDFVFDMKLVPKELPPPDFRRRLQKCTDMAQALYHRVMQRIENPEYGKQIARRSGSRFLRA